MSTLSRRNSSYSITCDANGALGSSLEARESEIQMQMRRVVVVVLGLSILVALPANAAVPQPCETVCSSTAQCGWVCSDGGTRTTCGAWGSCDPSQCTPDYSLASSEAIGVRTVYFDWGLDACRMRQYAINTWRDRSCGFPDIQTCDCCRYHDFTTYGPAACPSREWGTSCQCRVDYPECP